MADHLRKDLRKALRKLEDQLTCGACLQVYPQSKVLHCFHIFCQDCLQPLVKQTAQGQTVECPQCHKATPLPHNGVPGLQGAFFVNGLFDVLDIMKKVSSTVEQAKDVEGDITVKQVTTDSTVTDDIIALLDKRVAERLGLADPTYMYVPPPSLLADTTHVPPTSLLHARKHHVAHIPTHISKTAQKFNKAHDKEFNKMESISDYYEKKVEARQKLASPMPSAKRRKLSAKTSSTRKATSFRSKLPPLPPENRRKTFLPITATKKRQPFPFRFRGEGSKTHDSDKMFTFTATARTSPAAGGGSRSAKTVPAKDRNRKYQYRPHLGKLPNFTFSIF